MKKENLDADIFKPRFVLSSFTGNILRSIRTNKLGLKFKNGGIGIRNDSQTCGFLGVRCFALITASKQRAKELYKVVCGMASNAELLLAMDVWYSYQFLLLLRHTIRTPYDHRCAESTAAADILHFSDKFFEKVTY